MSFRNQLIIIVGLLALLAVAIEVYAGARTDLDWMIVCNKFQFGGKLASLLLSYQIG